MTTLICIIGLFIGVIITSTLFYTLKLRKLTLTQHRLIEKQQELIKVLTLASFGEKYFQEKKEMEKKEKKPSSEDLKESEDSAADADSE